MAATLAGRGFSELELRHDRESGVLEALTAVAMDDRPNAPGR